MECKFCWDWNIYICKDCKEKQNQYIEDWLNIWYKTKHKITHPHIYPNTIRNIKKPINEENQNSK